MCGDHGWKTPICPNCMKEMKHFFIKTEYEDPEEREAYDGAPNMELAGFICVEDKMVCLYPSGVWV